jgi:transposase
LRALLPPDGTGKDTFIAGVLEAIDNPKLIAALATHARPITCATRSPKAGQPVIPPKRNRTFKRPYDSDSTRSATSSRFFNKLKQFRLVATRYDKLFANFGLRQTSRYRGV